MSNENSLTEMDSACALEKTEENSIKINTSPYEQVSDRTHHQLGRLKQLWTMFRNNYIFRKYLHEVLAESENAYVTAFQLTIYSGDFYSGKQFSLALCTMEIFAKWVQNKDLSHLLTKDLKTNVFELITRQKNRSFVSMVIHTYRLLEDKEIFLPIIKNMVDTRMFKEACQYASSLNLHQYFSLDEFVIPLFLQQKHIVVEEFLRDSEDHQYQFIIFLDKLVGTKNVKSVVEVMSKQLNIPDIKLHVVNDKPLSKLITKMLKTFDISTAYCPNFNFKRGRGALWFLINKRFNEHSIGKDSWTEMVEETVGSNMDLHVELVDTIAMYGDIREALEWAQKFKLPEDYWPCILLNYYREKCEAEAKTEAKTEAETEAKTEAETEADKDKDKDKEKEKDKDTYTYDYSSDSENWDISDIPFHKLPAVESFVMLIDTPAGFSYFLQFISETPIYIVGIDTEWKPKFGIHSCDLALIQIATVRKVFILDVIKLQSQLLDSSWKVLGGVLFENKQILKLGFGLSGDMETIKKTIPGLAHIKKYGPGYLDLAELWRIMSGTYSFEFPFKFISCSGSSRSLTALVELCLGKTLDKSNQFSNWENRPLRKAQVSYAALDAYVLIEVYNVLCEGAKLQSIPIVNIISDIMKKQPVQKKKDRINFQRHTYRPNREKVTIDQFRVLCDSMLIGLGRKLRSWGFDTEILEGAELPSEKHVKGNLPLYILTKRKDYSRFKPFGTVCIIRCDNLNQQYEDFLNFFNIQPPTIPQELCPNCNSKDLDEVHKQKVIAFNRKDMKVRSLRCGGKTNRRFLYAAFNIKSLVLY